jgi:5-methylcytosine-specific restriction endonuclease McrA
MSNDLVYMRTKHSLKSWGGKIYASDWGTISKKIMERDKYICRVCGCYGFHVHHVDYNPHNNVEGNLVTICKHCHPKTNYYKEYWSHYFNKGYFYIV